MSTNGSEIPTVVFLIEIRKMMASLLTQRDQFGLATIRHDYDAVIDRLETLDDKLDELITPPHQKEI